MKERLEKRLAELRAEREKGEAVLAELQARQVSLRETLLRIEGAIQVLEEELAAEPEPGEVTPPVPGLVPLGVEPAAD